MAPDLDRITELKPDNGINLKSYHQIYYSTNDTGVDTTYKYDAYKPYFPVVDWDSPGEIDIVDRGLFADTEKKALLGAAKKVQHLTPAIGTEITGIDLRQLTSAQKDELALLVAERGVVFFRDQELNIHEQVDLTRHFGPLLKHPTAPVPKEPGLEEVHVVYNDGSKRPDNITFSKMQLWHSDLTFERQPPSTASFKVITSPDCGGDTLWSSGYGLYSSLSPGMQTYLEGLSALHSGIPQADRFRSAGLHVRRELVDTIHPVVRVHPVTGWKCIYVNPTFTVRIVGVPKAESDAILSFLYEQISSNVDFQVRFHWEANSIAIWDNRSTTHSGTYDFWPNRRHALRVTPIGERPLSVKEYEERIGKVAKDRQDES